MRNLMNSTSRLAAIARDFAIRRATLNAERRGKDGRLKLLVVGGGPAGLSFALTVSEMLGDGVAVVVCDARWKQGSDGRVVWLGAEDGVNRRDQIVTLQSMVYGRFSPEIVAALFANGSESVWPSGSESPPEQGPPLNVSIRGVEDGLLDLANRRNITLVAQRIDPETLPVECYDLIVIADGVRSQVREYFRDRFGMSDPTPYSLRGMPVEDRVLALRFRTRLHPEETVVQTIIQQRFLFNGLHDEGYLYVRLTPGEASEVRGVVPGTSATAPCIQSAPCVMRPSNRGYVCATHGARFAPAEDPSSLLWPRLKEGLWFFGATPDDVTAITSFGLSMDRRGLFVAELTPTGFERPTFGALIGDAAGALHFWPGRGMNAALSSATALAATVARTWTGRPLRSADFAPFEATMAALQSRHKDRAWRNMVVLKDGEPRTIAEIFADVQANSAMSARDACANLDTMRRRTTAWSKRLEERMKRPIDVTAIHRRLESLSPATLNVLVAGGAWETRWSGGPETDVERYVGFPVAAE